MATTKVAGLLLGGWFRSSGRGGARPALSCVWMAEWALKQRWESPSGTIRYDVFGGGPPLVLVHGTPSSTYLWRHVIPKLASERTVYAYDLLGYGASEKRDNQDVSLGAQTRLLAQLLDHWELEQPAIVGHDFGGAITLRTHLLERRPFSAIALLDPVALGPGAHRSSGSYATTSGC